jgi:hypothetical protein
MKRSSLLNLDALQLQELLAVLQMNVARMSQGWAVLVTSLEVIQR